MAELDQLARPVERLARPLHRIAAPQGPWQTNAIRGDRSVDLQISPANPKSAHETLVG